MGEPIGLGELLVRAGLVTDEHVTEAMRRADGAGTRLSSELIELGALNETELAQVLSNQLSMPLVNLQHVSFSPKLLERLPADVASHHSAIPVYVRKQPGRGETLFVAIEDPTDATAVQEVSGAVALPVKWMIAKRSEIRRAIAARYFNRESAPEIISEEPAVPAPTGISKPPPTPPDARGASTPPSAEKPKNRISQPGPGLTVTLLDGTTLQLTQTPGMQAGGAETNSSTPPQSQLATFLATADPDRCARALIALLARKGLITEAEFRQAYDETEG